MPVITHDSRLERDCEPLMEADADTVRRVLDKRARADLGLTIDEFLAALRGGRFDGQDTPAIQTLVGIASLLA